jgi:hypothetical protein
MRVATGRMYERIFEKRVKVRVWAPDSARSESACVRVLLA